MRFTPYAEADNIYLKEETSTRSDPLKLSFPQGTTSLHIEYKVACVGVACNAFYQLLRLNLARTYTVDFQKVSKTTLFYY